MENYFANYNQSLALKELGFDMPCFRYVYIGDTGNNIDRYEEAEPSRAKNYNKYFLCISQPLKSQVFDWFRDKHDLQSNVSYGLIFSFIINNESYEDFPNPEDNWFRTYEEAESACIDKLIELCHDK